MQVQPRSLSPSAVPSAHAHLLVREAKASILAMARNAVGSVWAILFLLVLVVDSTGVARGQQPVAPETNAAATQREPALPFEVSNPKHKKWPEAEATRIYTWACDLLARTIRPEKPPELHPKFRLVLGTADDELVRDRNATEIHLKNWNPEKFAQGVVVVALRDLVPSSDLAKLARQSVSLADATLDASEVRH